VQVKDDTFQSDCSLIGGDSGGPLFDLDGKLVGIHSRVGQRTQENMHVPMREFVKNWDGMLKSEFIGEGPFAKRPEKGKGFLGIGTEPHVPEPLKPLVETPGVPVIHATDYLAHRQTLLAADHITVVGSGQSGAEVFLDLLRNRPTGHEGLHWLGRTEAFAPMEYSKLGLEHFTPDYTRYFHALPESVRDRLGTTQWQLHRGIDADTIAAIHDELYRRTLHGGWPEAVLTPGVHVRTAGRVAATKVELHLEHTQQGTRTRLTTDAVVLATGYRDRPLDRVLAGLDPYLRRDNAGRPRIDEQFGLVLDPAITGSGSHVYVQNAELHTHGVGTPDLGLVAWRSAAILNSLTGSAPYPQPARTAFTTFGLEPPLPQVPTPRQSQEREKGQHHVLTPLVDGI
jgi:lysine N6-hydroxylase